MTTTARKEVFDFPVERCPQYIHTASGELIKSDKDSIVRTDTNVPIGYVSAAQMEKVGVDGSRKLVDRNYYQVVTHTELVEEARAAIKSLGLKAHESSYLMNNGGRLFQQFDFDGTTIEPAPGDYINMRLTLVNSYDLSRPVGFELGGLRQVCTNGLIAFVKAFFEMKKHSGGFNMDITMQNLTEAINTFQIEVRDTYAKMHKTPIGLSAGKDFIAKSMKDAVVPTKYGELIEKVWETPEKANEIIPELDNAGKVILGQYQQVVNNVALDRAKTLWTLYNAYTLILTHYVMSIERRMSIHAAIQTRIAKLMK